MLKQSINQPNGKKSRHRSIKWQSTSALHEKDENGSIFAIFIDGPIKPPQPTHYHHCVIHPIPEAMSERHKGKDGETMTKNPKRMRTTLTCGRPVRRVRSGHVSLPIFNQNQQTMHHYIRHVNTVLMNVLS